MKGLPPQLPGIFKARLIISDRKWTKSKANNATILRHTITLELWPGEWLSIIGCLIVRNSEGNLNWTGPMTYRGRTAYRNVTISPAIASRIVAWFETTRDRDGQLFGDKIGVDYILPRAPLTEDEEELKKEIEI